MPLGIEAGFGPGHIMLDGDPAPSPTEGYSPTFRPMLIVVKASQTAEWIKMPLGTKAGFGTGNIVFDADPSPPPQRAEPLQFSAQRLDG